MIKFTLTLVKELNDWLVEQARLNGRSKNKHIEHLLKQAKIKEETDKNYKE